MVEVVVVASDRRRRMHRQLGRRSLGLFRPWPRPFIRAGTSLSLSCESATITPSIPDAQRTARRAKYKGAAKTGRAHLMRGHTLPKCG